MTIPNHSYTTFVLHECRPFHDEEDEVVIACDDCGAYTLMEHELMVEHYPGCCIGESQYWEDYYNAIDDNSFNEDEEEENS